MELGADPPIHAYGEVASHVSGTRLFGLSPVVSLGSLDIGSRSPIPYGPTDPSDDDDGAAEP